MIDRTADDAGGLDPAGAPDMHLFDLRIEVDSIAGRSVCGMRVGDFCEIRNSNELTVPEGRHFCVWALASALPFIAAKQRRLPAGDWLENESLIACPDPEEGLVMRIVRTREVGLRAGDLT